MPNNFEQLAAIIGPVLTIQVMKKMGGRLIRIRKHFISNEEAYLDNKEYYDTCSLRMGAGRLGCGIQTLKNLRLKHRDQL